MIYYAHKVQNPVFNPLKSEDTPDESISSFTEMPEWLEEYQCPLMSEYLESMRTTEQEVLHKQAHDF